MGKKVISRTEAEKGEGLDTIQNQVPENRMQSEQQVQDTDSALKTEPVNNGFAMQHTKTKGSKLKQESVAEVLSGGSDSGMGIGAGGRSVSGTSGGILTADNSTPVADKVRSKSRVGKKFDRLATKLNFTPCEQALVDFDESKPLADSSNEDQGYNGTYRNEFARSQKHSGAVPGDLMFERSVDMIMKDQLYYSEGQIVLPNDTMAARCAYTPSQTYTADGEYDDYEVPVGDFVHRALHAKIDYNGRVRYVYFDVDDVTAIEPDPDLANKEAVHRKILENSAELDRIVMDAKAGDEKADIWSPIPRAINQPSKSIYLMKLIENQTGVYPYIGYSKAGLNFSYQLNRACKDGQDITTPAVEQLLGSIYDFDSEDEFSDEAPSVSNCFKAKYYAAGSPALMIDVYDSKAKYNNKADLLLQPRGFRMHLQTADNNINSLKVKKQFIDVYSGQEVFSTIDHEYDPLLPICMTDKAALIDALNMNYLNGFGMSHFFLTYSGSNIEVNGAEDDSVTEVRVYPDVLNTQGLYVFQRIVADGHDSTAGAGLVLTDGVIGWKKDGTNRDGEKVEILLSHNDTVPAGFTLLGFVNADLDVVLRSLKTRDGGANHDRITAGRYDIDYDSRLYMYHAGPYKYAYSDLRNNYVVTVYHPLVEGIVKYFTEGVGAKFYERLEGRELSIPWVFSTQYATLASYLICAALPWIQQVRQNAMKDVIYYEDNIREYPFSGLISIKDAPFENFVNFGYSGYDEPLATKVMTPTVAIKWIMPEFFWKVDPSHYGYVAPWYFNQNELECDGSGYSASTDAADMSMPSIRSGIRLASLDTLYSMTEKDIRLSLDRMSASLFNNDKISLLGAYKYGLNTDGQIFVRFASDSDFFTIGDILSTPRELGLTVDAPGLYLTGDGLDGVECIDYTGMTSSFRIKVWTSKSVRNLTPDILSRDVVDISRGANYIQKWYQVNADDFTTNKEILGLIFGMNDEGCAEFSPFIGLDDDTAISDAPVVVSRQRSLWTRIQMLPFVISPFDAVASEDSDMVDLFEIPYVFGLAGFRASDYRESVYNREKEVVNQGMLFVTDPWIEASPIIKRGASNTGVAITKGYELGK